MIITEKEDYTIKEIADKIQNVTELANKVGENLLKILEDKIAMQEIVLKVLKNVSEKQPDLFLIFKGRAFMIQEIIYEIKQNTDIGNMLCSALWIMLINEKLGFVGVE
jgi:2-hydroxy-3-keto-5-methylthiopentenyl-1-phosphate phosphatase